jgi:drug/metabolite transporter (DMT)-like permease
VPAGQSRPVIGDVDKSPQIRIEESHASPTTIHQIVLGGDEMNAVKIIGVVLIVAGVLGLAYGSFSFTKETHEAKIGPLELQVKDKETVKIPAWAGVGAIVIGAVLLLVPLKR